MLSSKYSRLEYICNRISNNSEVQLDDMIWADKLTKLTGPLERCCVRHVVVKLTLTCRKARWMTLNQMDLGDPDPQRHRNGFDNVDQIVEWFHDDKPEIGVNGIHRKNLLLLRPKGLSYVHEIIREAIEQLAPHMFLSTSWKRTGHSARWPLIRATRMKRALAVPVLMSTSFVSRGSKLRESPQADMA